jgi:hypothetical protein
VACGDDGISSFDGIRYRHHDASVFLYAFDLIELSGDDLPREPLAVRKSTLASLLARAAPGLRFNVHLDENDGPLVFAQACKMGLSFMSSFCNRAGSAQQTSGVRYWPPGRLQFLVLFSQVNLAKHPNGHSRWLGCLISNSTLLFVARRIGSARRASKVWQTGQWEI